MTFLEFLPQTKAEAVADAVALGSVASPWWLPLLKETSETAALLMPIAGVIWLSVQIAIKVHTTYWKNK